MMRSNRQGHLLAAGLAALSLIACSSSSNQTPPPPTATAPAIGTQPAPATVVSGASATFTVAATGNGTLTYQWRKDGAALATGTGASLALSNVTAANAGVYDCIVTNTLGSSSSAAVSSGAFLFVNSAPAIVAQPVAQTTAPGGSVFFMVAASGNGTLSYSWQKDGVAINTAASAQASYAITSASTSDAGQYSCVVTNTLGSTTTTTTTAAVGLTVTTGSASAPSISVQPAPATAATGGSATFTVSATGNGTLSYQWRKNGVMLASATNSTAITAALTITNVGATDAGVYDCVVTNSFAGTTSATGSAGAILSVNGAPVILAQPTNQAAALNGSVTFTVIAAAAGNGSLAYQWQKDGSDIQNATNASYTVAPVTNANTGSYLCVITSTLNGTTTQVSSAAASLSIASSPVIQSQTSSQTIAEGGTASFGVTANGTGLTYQWYQGSTALSDGGKIVGSATANLTVSNVALTDAANYSCIVTSTQGGASTTGTSNAAPLVVVAKPVIVTPPSDTTISQTGSGSLSVSASANGNLTYQWRQNGADITDNPTGTASTLVLTGVAVIDAGNYDCVVTNTIAGVSISTTSAAAALTVNTTVAINAQPASVTQIETGTAILTVSATGATGAVLSYQWQKNGLDIPSATLDTYELDNLKTTDAASYTCNVTATLNGATTTIATNPAIVAVNTFPVITNFPVVQNVVVGSTATFSVTASSATGTLSYQWKKNGQSVGASGTQSSFSPSAASTTNDGAIYTCDVFSTLGTSTTPAVTTPGVALNIAVAPATVTVAVTSTPAITSFKGDGTETFPTITATVSNLAQLNGNVTYQWKKALTSNLNNAVTILGATGPSYSGSGAPVSATDWGFYICTVTNNRNGAIATATASPAVQIQVLATPLITADLPANTYAPSVVGPPLSTASLTVGAAIPGGGTLTFQWFSTPDGTYASGAAISGATSASFSAPGNSAPVKYFVTVGNKVTNVNGTFTSTTVNSAVTTLTFYQKAAITTQPPATTVAVAGTSVSLAIVPTAVNTTTFPGTSQSIQWFKGPTTNVGTAIAGATSAILSFPSVAGTDTNNYWAVVTNSLPGASSSGSSTVTSTIAKLSVNTLPTIVSQPPAAPIAAEGTFFNLLTVNAVGAPNAALSYQWQKNGASIAGATTAGYTIASPSAANDTGSYTCVITSSVTGTPAQTVTTGPYNLTVNLKPTFSGPPTPSGTTVPVVLTVNTTNLNTGSILTYAWRRNGTAITGATLPTYTATIAGNYSCDVSSVFAANGNSNSSTATATSPIAAVTVGTLTTPVVTFGSSPCTTTAGVTTCSAGMTGITASTPTVANAISYDWSATNGSITAGNGTPSVTVTAGTNTALPMTLSVAVSVGSAGAVGNASATLVPAITQAKILAPARVHPGDTWMTASIDSQAGATTGWTLNGQGGFTGLTLPFSASASAQDGDSITLTASATNGADAAPTASKTVAVTTGTWIQKDGGVTWDLGAGSAAAVFANGRVLVCGGQTVSSFTPAGAAIYDPATRRWTRVADMNVPRTGHTATALPNGSILVTGGTSGPSTNVLNTAEIYDPILNTWTLLASNLGTGRVGHAATLLPPGVGAQAGSVVISGGKFSSSDFSTTVMMFRPSGTIGGSAGGNFTASPVGLNVTRAGHTATALNDGRVLIVGGTGVTQSGFIESLQQAEIFDPTSSSTSAWTMTRLGSLTNQPRAGHTATLLPNGTVLIAGSSTSSAAATAETFDPATGAFTATTGNMIGGYVSLPSPNTTGRQSHAAIVLTTGSNAGKVLITGGSNGSAQGEAQGGELYDPVARTFSQFVTGAILVAPMNVGRNGHNLVPLTDGTIMALGGNPSGGTFGGTASTETYDPVNNTWSLIGAPARNNATLTLIPNSSNALLPGKLMLVGGQNERAGTDKLTNPSCTPTPAIPCVNLSVSATAHIYDIAAGTWTNAASMANARWNHAAVLITKDGKRQLLVAGGIGTNSPSPNVLNTAELYDPSTDTWSPAGTLNVARQSFGMIELPNGKVLIMGGSSTSNPNPTIGSSEIYDPATNTWAFTTDSTSTQTTLSENKTAITPILLKTGMVVVAGGSIDSSTFSSAVELFDYTKGTWTVLPTPLSVGRVQHLSVALPDGPNGKGRFVLLGGKIPGGTSGLGAGVFNSTLLAGNAIEIYDTLAQDGSGNQIGAVVPTVTSHFNFTNEPRSYGGANLKAGRLPGGKILLTSIALNGTTGASDTEVYDPATDTLTVGPALPTGQGSTNGSGSVQGFNLGFDADGNPFAGDVMFYGGGQSDTFTQIYRPQ
jgi:hypothetical protein